MRMVIGAALALMAGAGHAQDVAALEARARAAATAFMDAEESGAGVPEAEAAGVFVTTRAAALARGSAEMRTAWQARGTGAPAADWIAARAALLGGQARSIEVSEANLKANVAADAANSFGVVIGLERLHAMTGYTEGAARELARIAGEAQVAAPLDVAALGDGMAARGAALTAWGRSCRQALLTVSCGGGS